MLFSAFDSSLILRSAKPGFYIRFSLNGNKENVIFAGKYFGASTISIKFIVDFSIVHRDIESIAFDLNQ
jgi:hypothetical protein